MSAIFEGPIPTGKFLLDMLVKLLEIQENVTIEYEIVKKEKEDEKQTTSAS